MSFSGNITIDKKLTPENQVRVISDHKQDLTFELQINQLNLKNIDIDGQTYQTISANNLSEMMLKGQPDVPKMAFSIKIPDQLWLNRFEILDQKFVEYENINLAPSKGIVYRNENPSDLPFIKGAAYFEDAFFPKNMVQLGSPYIVRDCRGESVQVHPIQYNPVTKTLRVYTYLKIKTYSNLEVGINPIKSSRKNPKIDSEFSKLYQKLFINYNSDMRYTALEDQGNLLIITHSDFTAELKSFVNWKRQRGISTEVVELSTTGTTANEIKSYIETYYNDNGLTYVILIGDNTHIPSLSSNGDSDQAYAQISGDDHYPELIIGRFSVETLGDITTMVDKAIWYEKEVTTADSWLESATGIASNEGGSSSDDGETDQEHMENIRTKLTNYGYTTVDQGYDNLNITSSQLEGFINEGRGLINYVGHGADNSWVTTGFSSSDVDGLSNENKLPFIFDVACVNGNFHNQTCFAEAWTRANNGGKLTGAVAIIASTINQPWSPPMDGQDEMVNVLVESYSDNIRRTFGGITYNGVMHMMDEYPSDNGLTADTWTIFGDPSLHVRTKTPMVLSTTHASSIVLGASSFTVNCTVEGTTIALSKMDNDNNIVLLGSGVITGGSVSIDIPGFTEPTQMIVTATGYNYIPEVTTVNVISPNGPYLVFNNFSINDQTENNNNLVDYGENILLNIGIENVGTELSTNANVTLSSENSNLSISDNTEAYGNIISNQINNLDAGFAFSLTDDIQDQEVLSFNLTITDDAAAYSGSFNIIANAPKLALEFVSLSDALGNNNGVMDSGEEVNLTVKGKNIGHANTMTSVINALESSSYFELNQTEYTTGILNALNGENTAVFTGTVAEDVPEGSIVDFTFDIVAGAYTDQITINLPIGISIEDWESETFDTYDWSNETSNPWVIVSDVVYDGNNSAKSGAISNSQNSSLTIEIETNTADTISFYKKVSCEESPYDGYWYDFLKFEINGLESGQWDGEIDWSREAYAANSGTNTFKWTYKKDNMQSDGADAAWIDNIILPPHAEVIVTQYTSVINSQVFKLFPNPAKDIINISYTLANQEDIQIHINDVNGRLVKSIVNKPQVSGSYSSQITGLNLESGVYFVNFITKNDRSVKKLIIQ